LRIAKPAEAWISECEEAALVIRHEILALVPARGGSKGVPGKNIRPLAGKPLIDWSIEAAMASRYVTRTLVSTDDPEIADVARRCGADTPFLRPVELALDNTPQLAVAEHALDWLQSHEHGYTPDYLLLLQPTSPLRSSADIDAAIEIARGRHADSVVSVCEAHPHPRLCCRLSETGVLTRYLKSEAPPDCRQDLPPAYALNGAIYLVTPARLRAERSFLTLDAQAYIMPPERSLDIDTVWDFRLAEMISRGIHD
jgi:CMP-N,N'-diacetyllegionaminic acid synthase